jgi:hypothetical protein
MTIEVQWNDLRVGTKAALRSLGVPGETSLGGRSAEELIAITRGEIVVTGAPADAKVPRSVAGHAERRTAAPAVRRAKAKPPVVEPHDDEDDDDDEDKDQDEEDEGEEDEKGRNSAPAYAPRSPKKGRASERVIDEAARALAAHRGQVEGLTIEPATLGPSVERPMGRSDTQRARNLGIDERMHQGAGLPAAARAAASTRRVRASALAATGEAFDMATLLPVRR